MRKVYVEATRPPYASGHKGGTAEEWAEVIQERVRDAVGRVAERAIMELAAPVRLVSVSHTVAGSGLLLVVVMEGADEALTGAGGFSPLSP